VGKFAEDGAVEGANVGGRGTWLHGDFADGELKEENKENSDGIFAPRLE